MSMDEQSGEFGRQDLGDNDIPETADTAGPANASPLNAVVTVPAGLTLQSLEVSGRNLIITLSDGSEIFVPDGAVYVPQIIVDGTVVPPFNIAQLLTGNEPEPAAGPTPSSGGNFAGDEGEIQAAFDLGDLLPFTDFGFPEDEEEEIIPYVDEEPDIVIETPDNPAGVENAIATVDEEGLPERTNGEQGEPAGTNEPSNAETTSGTIVFNAPDGLSAILINGVEITAVGQTFSSPVGTLTITSINLATGEVGFSYTLEDNTLGEDRDGFFVATVRDIDGDEATATLTIVIVDDSPIAADDIGIVPAGSHAAITGDVLANDVPGADDYALDGAVTGFTNGTSNAEPGQTLQGEYGVLTLNADGSYTYVRDVNTPGGVEESFDYTIIDQDGSTSTATLTIRIGNAPNEITLVPETGAGTVVNESALPPRTDEPVGSSEGADGNPDNDSDPTENTGATITFNSPDGVESVTLNGVAITPGNLPQTIFSDDTGDFVVTDYTYDPVTGDGTITYEYTLGDNTSGDDTNVDIVIVVTDLDGDTAEDTLTIDIIDDEPDAADDNAGQATEDAPITIDVLGNDTVGADDVDPSTVAYVEGTLSGGGTLVNNGDGTFTYTPVPGEEGTVTFDYSITDGDGDTSVATATVELLPDSKPEGGETTASVDDDGLSGGNPASVTGDIDANTDDASADANEASFTGALPFDVFNDTPASISFDVALDGATASIGAETVTYSVAGNVLTATVTGGARDGTALFTVEITDTATGTYTVTLLDNVLHSDGNDENNAFASLDFVVTDSDGSTAPINLGIVFNDDAPTAANDAGAIAAGQYGPVGGNVLANDAQGADGATVTSYSGVQTAGETPAGVEVQGLYGKLTIAADGTYSYTRDPGTPGGVSETFTYTITDADGDPATAALVISIADGTTSLDLPVAGEDGTIVDEAGLDGPPAGSDAASDSETTAGTFTFTAQDGPATVLIDGVAVASVGQTFTGTYGTLVITAINAGSIDYSYTLTTNTSGDNTSDSFVVRVEDQDDDFSESTLEIAIVDDEPTANPDSDSVTEDGPLIADGNVLTGTGGADANASDGVADVTGADGAVVTAVGFGANDGTVGTALQGAYGSLTLDADGNYTYVLDNQNGFVQGLDSNETLTEEFTYTITDGDGDPATTTLTITINGDDDDVTIRDLDGQGAEVIVDEDDLADGSSPDAAALTKSGTFAVDSPDGLATLTVGGVTVFGAGVTYPVTIDDPAYGLLTITGVTPVLDGDGDVISATVSYTYVLQDNTLLHTGPNGAEFTESYTVVATDTDGSNDTASLDVTVVDDAPAANPDSDSVTEDGPLVADGNVLTGNGGSDANTTDGVADIDGADQATVTGVAFGAAAGDVAGSVGATVAGTYGTLVINADGSYTYTLDNANPLVQGLDRNETLGETFTYTITDGDGDTATTTLSITINGVDDPVVINGLDLDPAELTVDEDDLPLGSSPDAAELTQTGSFTITSPDGLAVVTAGGVTVWTDAGGFVAGQTITTPIGSFVITSVTPTTTDANGDVTEATVGFSYTLDDNTLTHTQGGQDTILESFAIEAIDTDGSNDTGSVDVLVIDDVPEVNATGQTAPQLVTGDRDIGEALPANDTGNFAGLFTTVFGADEAAAIDATVFALTINGGDGTDSLLNDTLTGENILLRLNSDTIEGYLETSGDIAFTLALDPATGDITQTQLRSIQHDNPADPIETVASGEAETMAADLIGLTATVTDGDGDTDSESIDIGGSFAFQDDGPFALVANGALLDEDDLPAGNQDAAPGDDAATGSNYLLQVDFGADGPAADEITVSFVNAFGTNPSTGTLALTSGGDAVIFDWNPATNTLTGYTANIADPVMTLTFDPVAGNVAVQLFKPLDHPTTDADGGNDGPETGYEDNVTLVFNVAVTDGDGDSEEIDFVLSIDDDMAIAVADVAQQATENQPFLIDALANDAFGADGVDTTDATKVFVSTQAAQGTVTYDPATGQFTYTPDAGAGSNGNTADFFEYTIVDGDGDATTARVDVTLQPDSEPLGGTRTALLDDDGLAGGNPLSVTGDLSANVGDISPVASEASYAGNLFFDVGNDGPATISVDPAIGGTTAMVGTETVEYSVAGNILTATVLGGDRDGTPLFTVEIVNAQTGEYLVTLLDNVIHPAGGAENDASVSIDFLLEDSDGDVTTTNLSVLFDDDAPTTTDNDNTVDEGAIVGGNLLTDDDGAGVDAAGADGFGPNAVIALESITSGGTTSTVDASGNLVITTALGTLTVNAATGAYSYESASNSTNADTVDVFTYTTVDGDGDEATATLTIDVVNAPGQVSDNDVLVNEAGLANGSDPASDSEIDADGQITVVGGSGTLVYSLNGGVAGPGANEVQIDGTYGTIVLNTQTGAYTYTLDTPFTDSEVENSPNLVTGAESFTYVVRDSNNNEIGTDVIVVNIIDDVPTATDQGNIDVAEDLVGTIGGNVMTDGTPDTQGADGATVTAITVEGNTTAVPQNGTNAVVATLKGTYTIDMDGNWTFDPNPNQDQSAGNTSADFTYTLTDGDDDFDTAVQPITIVDGAPPVAGPPVSLALDDQNLADGSTPGATTDSDTITFTPGSDDIASIVLGDTSLLGGGLTWLRVSDTQITGSDGGRLVVTLDLSVTNNVATVTATLNDNYDDHPTLDVDDVVDLGDVAVIATDIDGDTASALVSVSVSDDLPSISATDPVADTLLVDETDLATDASADFSTLFTSTFNADNPGTPVTYALGINAGATGIVDVATNEAVVLVLNGGVVEGRTETSDLLVFTVSVDAATGEVTLDQQRAVVHANPNDDNDATGFAAADLITLSATIVDSDGDTDTATANIAGAMTFLDDGPDAVVSNAVADMLVLDESPLPAAGDGIASVTASLADNFGAVIDYGADGAGSVSYALLLSADGIGSGLYALGAGGAQGDEILLTLTGDTVTGSAGGTDYFTITVDAATGDITFTQLENIWHGDATDDDDVEELTLDGAGEFLRVEQTVTDRDGDSDSATIELGNGVFKIEDDGPSVGATPTAEVLTVDETDLATDATADLSGAFAIDYGTDGAGSTAYTLSISAVDADSGLVDVATGEPVLLRMNGTTVEGYSATGGVVFTVTVTSGGVVELDQLRAVEHTPDTGPDQATGLTGADLITLTATATDADGDQASGSIDLTGALTFKDDAPAIDATVTDGDTVMLVTQDADTIGAAFDTDVTSANFGGAFTLASSSYGADGAGTTSWSFALVVDNAVSGLSSDGAPINLFLIGGEVVGSTAADAGSVTAGNTIFSIAVDPATGVVTLTQFAEIDHALPGDVSNYDAQLETLGTGLVSLEGTATIIDRDGDSVSDTVTLDLGGNVKFADDGPSIEVDTAFVAPSLEVDETDLSVDDDGNAFAGAFSSDFGADGAGSIVYSFVVAIGGDSGLVDVATGQSILLYKDGDDVVGRVIGGPDDGAEAFRLTVDAAGNVSLDQVRALTHPNALDADDPVSPDTGSIQLLAIITDGDGDRDSAIIDLSDGIVFRDDGPSAELSGTNDSLTVSDADYGTDDSENFADNFTFGGGADGIASTSFALSAVDQTDSGLIDTATGNSVFLFLEGGAVVGREGTDAASAAAGQEVFRVTVDGSGNVTLDQSRAIDHALSTGSDGSTVSLASDGLIQLIGTVTDNDGDTDSVTLDIGSDLSFTDDTPTAEPTLTAYLDDDTQPGGDAGGPGDQTPDTDNLTGTLVDPVEGFGNDGGSVAFDLGSILPTGFRLVVDPFSDGVIIQQEQGTGNWVAVVNVTLNAATGGYSVSQLDNILHTDDGANDENEVTFTLGATLTDGDGDTATTSLTIVVDDDTPRAVGGTSTGTVDEDGLPNGIAGGIDDVAGESTVASGSVASFFATGADTPLTFSFDAAGAQAYLATLGLSSGGTGLFYIVSGNQITATAGNGGAPVFTMFMASNGDWQFTLVGALDHDPANDENDLPIEFGPLVQATDADGDTVTATGSLTVIVDDDTPEAQDDTNALTEDTASVGGNILTDPTADGFGADGAGNPAITAISGSGGAGTVGGTTTGTWGTLSLSANGTYTYTLNTAAVQGLDDGEFETDTFTYTIVDADGDSDTATLTITINGANDAPVAVADTNWTVEDAAAAITGNVLQDVPHPGAPSGTFADVADTDVDGDTLSVTTTGTFNGTYGVLTLNADGSYSYDLYTEAQDPVAYAAVQALNSGDTPLTDSFNYTASDGDDSDASTLTISIFGANDAPEVVGSITAVSEEGLPGGLPDNVGSPTDTTNLFTTSGQVTITDADDTTFVVTLGLPTTPGLTSGGLPVSWQVSPDGKVLIGSTAARNVFLVEIDDTGSWDVTLLNPIDHTANSVEDIFTFDIPVSVSDGTATTTITDGIEVTIEDDSPVAVVADASSGTNAGGTTITADLDIDDDVDNNFGGDGGKVIFTAATITTLEGQGLTSGFAALEYSISTDGTVLTAVKEGTTDTVFTITLDPLSAEDHYVVNLVEPIDSTSTIDFNDSGYDFVGGNGSWAGFNLPGTVGSQDLLLTPIESGTSAGSLNTNANEGGVSDGNSVKTGEAVRADFIVDLVGNPPSSADYEDAGGANHTFSGHYTVNGAGALFTSITGGAAQSTVKLTAFDDNDGDNTVGDGTPDDITSIAITYGAGSQVITTNGSYSIGGRTFTVVFDPDGTVDVAGVVSNTRIVGFTDDGFTSIEFENIGGRPFKIGDFIASSITNDPVSFNVPISVTDNDDDVVASGNLAITLNPAAPPVALDLDGDGVEFVDMSAGVGFDYDGDGLAEATAWVGADDGILARDANGDGAVNDASEFVFGGKDQTDLEAIAAQFDDNGDGVLDASDSAFSQFGVWQDANQNGVSDAGEFRTLAEAGIVSINLVSDGIGGSAAGGDVTIFGASTFTWNDGETGTVLDVAFANVASNDNASTGKPSELAQQLANMRGNARTAEIAAVAALASSVLIGSDPVAPIDGLAEQGGRWDPVFARFADASDGPSWQHATFESNAFETGSLLEGVGGPVSTDFTSIIDGPAATADVAGIPLVSQAQANVFETVDWFDGGIAPANSPAAFASSGMSADQAMEALLILDGEAASVAKVELETADAVLADIAAENLLDQVIDSFTGQSDASDYLVAKAGGSVEGLLDQGIDSQMAVTNALHVVDQQLDDAAAATAQA